MPDKEVKTGDQSPTGKVRIDALIPADLADKLTQTAEENDRTKTAEIIRALQRHLADDEAEVPSDRRS